MPEIILIILSVLLAASITALIILSLKYRKCSIKTVSREIIANSFPQPLIVLNEHYCFVEMNNAAIDIFPDLINSSPNTPVSRIYPVFDRILHQPLPSEYDICENIYEIYLHELVYKDKLIGYAVLCYDVTDRQNHMLELLRMKEEAVNANEAKNTFLANIGNEIKAPITTIIGISEVVLQLDMEAELKNIVENVYNSSVQLLELANHILDFSKLESGKTKVHEDKYLLQSLIYDIHNLMNMKLKDKDNVVFKANIDSSVPSGLIGDILMVKEILINFLNSSVKYTRSGSIELNINWQKVNDMAELDINIRDNGTGFKIDKPDKVFNAYCRIDSRTEHNEFSTDLGLAIANSYIKLLGGSLIVNDINGCGTSLSIKLKQKIYDYSPVGQSGLTYDIEDFHTQQINLKNEFLSYAGARVLVVDDLQLNLQIISNLLRPYNMQLEYANNGLEALSMIEKRNFDIVFLDHIMPEMDGIDVIREIRAKDGKKYQELIVIALTSNVIFGVKDFFISNGFNDYLEKPIHMRQLLNIFKHHLPEAISDSRNASNAPVYEYIKERLFISEDCFDCNIDDINTETGIRNAGGSLTLYKEVLQSFCSETGEIKEKLENYTKLSFEQLIALVREIKSSSANIGAVILFDKSRELEAVITENNSDFINDVMPAYINLTDSTINSINVYLNDSTELA